MGSNPQPFRPRRTDGNDARLAVIEATMMTKDEFHTAENNINAQLLSMQKTINEQTWKIMGGLTTFMTVGLSVLYFALRH